MKNKKGFNVVLDISMLILMLIEISGRLVSSFYHELLGIGLIMSFILHNIKNRNWYKSIFKGRYNLYRTLIFIINAGLLISFSVLMISAVPISRSIFKFLDIEGGLNIRKLHTASSYIGLIFISLHLGFHMEMIINKVKNKINIRGLTKIVFCIIFALTFIWGIRSFIYRNILSKVIAYYSFDIASSNDSLLVAFGDYFCIVFFISFLCYFIMKFIKKHI